MKSDDIFFKKLKEKDLTKLHEWFQVPHVLKWYAKEKNYTLKEIQEKYLPRITDETISHFIIFDGSKPIGYIQFYKVMHHLPEGMKKDHPLFENFIPDELVGIDVFIADEHYLNTGFSRVALRKFINHYLRNQFRAALVDPDKNNKIAIKFFEKVGFKFTLSQDENHVLMLKKINDVKTNHTISYDPDPKFEDTNIIWQGICENAKKKRNLPPGKPFAFFIKDKKQEIKGGCSGYIYYGCFYVDLLWVEESLRGKCYGTQLMKKAENLAQENGCHFIAANTMDFEALDFYKKLGFEVEFQRTGFDNHSSMYFLKKDLSSITIPKPFK